MTKREFLESKGFKKDIEKSEMYNCYSRRYGNFIVYLCLSGNGSFFQIAADCIMSQKDIDNLQIIFNNVNRDFEEMMKCED